MARLFLIVILTAMVVTLVRWVLRRGESARRVRRAGHARNNAIRVLRFDQIDARVATQRCACGGPLRTISEGGTDAFRVVHTECRRCDEPTDLFFDVSAIQH